jgi:NAD(P)H-flavin reductase
MRTLSDMGATEVAAERPWTEARPWPVIANRPETADTVTLSLAPPEPYGYQPGQFNMLGVPGIGEVPISVSGDATAVRPMIQHTIRAVGAVTRALCAAEPGDAVTVRGPYGTHWPLEEAEGGDVMIVAGGIGLPPLRPAIRQVLANRERFGRVALLYGARTPADVMFPGELAQWRSRFDVAVEVTVDSAGRDWRGNVGVVPDLIGRVPFDPAATTAFTVGPEIMMRFTIQALLAAGVPAGRVFLSTERSMQCATGLCGHCQLGPFLVCRDGPVFRYPPLARWLEVREL